MEPRSAADEAPAAAAASEGSVLCGLFAHPVAGPLLALIVVAIIVSATTSTFLNAANLSLIVQQSVVVGTLALGQTFVILVSGIDLASGAIMALGTTVAGRTAAQGDPAIAMALGLVVCPATGYALNQTAWGVRVYAIGNLPSAARPNGVNVGRVVFSVYSLAGLFYALAAWQALGRTPIADPSGYPIANLDRITSMVIGGTSLFGGRGGVAGPFVGTLIVGVLKNGLTQAPRATRQSIGGLRARAYDLTRSPLVSTWLDPKYGYL